MPGFIYCRLSRDEDDERESLKNQREIIEKYINRIGDTIEVVAEDDNYIGMNFDRPGIKELYEAAQKSTITKKIKRLNDSINTTELEIEQILIEKIFIYEKGWLYNNMHI